MNLNKLRFRVTCGAVFILLLTFVTSFAQKWDTLATIPAAFTFPVVDVIDGKIHIMGGGGTGGATDLHYAYDPATDEWEPKAVVPYLAQQPAGAAVNGRIHFFGGGFPNTGTPLDDHYSYDPSADEWEQKANLTDPRAIHYAVALDNVLYTLAGQGLANRCETYDDTLDSWSMKNNLPDNVFWYGAHVATQGHIYRFCGGGYTAPNNNAHRYDPLTDSWHPLTDFPHATHGMRGAAIGNKIFLAGGYYDFLEREEVWIFDTDTETYSPGIPLPRGRNYHNMVALDSCLYIVGGNHAIDETIRTQLIRICPFEKSTRVDIVPQNHSLMLSVHDGDLTMQLPFNVSGTLDIKIYGMNGVEVIHRQAAIEFNNTLQVHLNDLSPGVYGVHTRSSNHIFTGSFIYH
jgi:N-acetylneuraminic acid mutarotase